MATVGPIARSAPFGKVANYVRSLSLRFCAGWQTCYACLATSCSWPSPRRGRPGS